MRWCYVIQSSIDTGALALHVQRILPIQAQCDLDECEVDRIGGKEIARRDSLPQRRLSCSASFISFAREGELISSNNFSAA